MVEASEVAEWFGIAADVAAIIAIVVGGLWTYMLFVRQRLRYPRAELDITVHHAVVGKSSRLLHVGLRINNTGHVLLRPQSAELRVRQVLPVDLTMADGFQPGVDPVPHGEYELKWPAIVQRQWNRAFEVEPGESDTLHADFVIEDEVELIQIYGFVRNPTQKRQDFGWGVTKFLSLSEGTLNPDRHDDRSGGLFEKQQSRQQDQNQRQQQREADQTSQQQANTTSGGTA